MSVIDAEARSMALSRGVALQILAEVAREQLQPGASGQRACPHCSGVIHWQVGRRRRAVTVSGACETPDCISFRS